MPDVSGTFAGSEALTREGDELRDLCDGAGKPAGSACTGREVGRGGVSCRLIEAALLVTGRGVEFAEFRRLSLSVIGGRYSDCSARDVVR
ncbi:hypothetical protein QRO11_12810 [Paracidovorax citrulli]|uniref:Uncharacterized protein n=1 Tax=Paracidovorax citrulli TaxID=80869 RepID=A0ABY9AIU8_PARCI|nr:MULTISPECIES: hypothetical protein [Paracidovorax]WIY31894.1 hypothetical protein QRO09_09300 [Paracidovorax citrulli]WIY32857.1 hypothetical protein QRO11_12810 [Paracidovorax citrulli]WIY41169.1 hypothetical protein QRO10_09565 [Paracidovorax citrulli]WIY46627.1 hypothetical protein QRO12_11470 [Paracidovorax citrulli]WIY46856.1 hypothetical protein QRO08_13420 [Paracidovorax citrulli]